MSKRLGPATSDELAKPLAVLFAALPTSTAGEDAELKMRAYLMALSTFSVDIVSEAVMSVLDGTADVSGRFAPTPPELARICRDKQARYERYREREERKSGVMLEYRPSRDEAARMAAKADMLIAQLERTAADDKLKREQAEPVFKALRGIADNARRRVDMKQADGGGA